METKTVILTKGSREIDIHEIDDVIVNHEPTTYDTKKDIFSCRYCKRMYQSPIWLEQHEAECDLRADSKFKKIIGKQSNPTENRVVDPTNHSLENESNPSPENESNIDLEPSSPIFYMPAHNHIDAYDSAYQANQNPSTGDHCNNEHQIYPHEDYENNQTTVTNDPNIDTNEIILEPMDSQPAETAETPTPSPMQTTPPPSDDHLTSTPSHNKGKHDNHDQEESSKGQNVDVPKLEPITDTTNELKDDEDSIVIYQDHQDSQETISDNEPEEMVPLNEEQNCKNEEAVQSNISPDEETDSEDDSEYETFSG